MAERLQFHLGRRVRHYGHQWPGAFRDGTAEVVGTGEHVFSDDSFELLVRVDSDGKLTWWNSLATVPVGKDEPTALSHAGVPPTGGRPSLGGAS